MQGVMLDGRYELLDRVGEGGMGEVWRARQTALGRVVAIKIIHPHQAGGVVSAEAAQQARSRFSREAELAARVEHRNVIDIIDYGTTEDGTQFLVMPFLKGRSLEDALAARPAQAVVLGWIRGMLGGLAAIHEAGIVHRDLKPANVFLAEDADGVIPKLLDFGISRSDDASGPAALTRLGTTIGTPQYMAPEQFESSRDVDARADVYSAGVILYEALSGRRPVEGDDPFVIYRAMLEGRVTPLRALRPDLPPSLESLVERAIARAPDQRFTSAREMREALDRVMADPAAAGGPRAPSASLAHARTAPAPTPPAAPTPPTALMASSPGVGPAPTPLAYPSPSPAPSSGRGPLVAVGVAVAAVALVGMAGAGFWLVTREGGDDTPPPVAAATTTTGEEPAPSAPPQAPAALAPASTPQGPTAHRVRYSESIERLAISWGRLDPRDHALDVRFVPEEDGWAIVTGPAVSAEDAARLATSLDSTPVPRPWDPSSGLTPSILRTTVRLNVHATPDLESAITRVLAQDTLVVGLEGEHPVGTSAPAGQEEGSAFFVASRLSSGWASTRYLAPADACLPIPAALVRLAGGDADAVREDFTAALTTATTGGGQQRAWLLSSRDAGTARSHVGLFAAGGDCRPGETLAHFAIDGVTDEVFLGDLRPSGATYVAVSWSRTATPPPSGMLEWAVFLPNRSEPIWRDRVATAPALGHDGGAVSGTRDRILASRPDYVLAVRRLGEARQYLRWTGTRIAP